MKRRVLSRTGLRCGLLLLALLALAGTIWWDNAVNRGIEADGPAPALAQVARGGVNVYNLQYEVTHDAQGRLMPDNKVAQTMRMIREGGFHWVRTQFPWEDIEICGKGNFQDCHHANQSTWLKYDYIVQQATANGLALIVRLDRPPDWARRGWITTPEVQAQLKLHQPVTGPPDRLADFGDYVAAVAQHYP
ncbi:MAG: polymerase, partial [Herpetosiphonaceae bacterium]|nr:polymerase [Herpetosiphonaceae bacterium]